MDNNWPLRSFQPGLLVEVFSKNDGSGLYGFRYNPRLPDLYKMSIADVLVAPGLVAKEMAYARISGRAHIVLLDDSYQMDEMKIGVFPDSWYPLSPHGFEDYKPS